MGLDEQRLITKSFADCLHLLVVSSQASLLGFFCEDKLSELQISVVGELSSAISLIFDEMCREFTFS